jgi:3-phytase
MSPFMHRLLAAVLSLTALTAAPARADRLELGKQALRLLDAQGHLRDEVPLRAKRWDQRQMADGSPLALLQDADSGDLLLLQAREGRLQRLARWPGPAFNLEALCLYLDPQRLLQVFLLSDDGLAEQWLLGQAGLAFQPAAETRPLRQLATAPGVGACQVRDADGLLLYVEPDVGLWATVADPERGGRRLLAPAPVDLSAWLARQPVGATAPALPWVQPSAQTQPVRGTGDAADDPAIWVHPRLPGHSLILATDKKRGLAVYDLQGQERQFLPVGRVNNVDLRQGLLIDGRRWDLAVATQRDEAAVVLFEVSSAGRVRELARLPSGLNDVYGVCSGRHPSGGLDVFVNDKDGRVHQLRLLRERGRWRTETVATVRLTSQPEGCVVDEAGRQVFLGEEKRGIWRLPLDRQGRMGDPELVLPVGGVLQADVEGMAVHHGPHGRRLVVSSQGNDRYVVLDADPPYNVRGVFGIGLNVAAGIDAASETDGLDVVAADLGGPYREGLLVVQDGHKRWPMGRQNFKLVPWRAVREALGLP